MADWLREGVPDIEDCIRRKGMEGAWEWALVLWLGWSKESEDGILVRRNKSEYRIGAKLLRVVRVRSGGY